MNICSSLSAEIFDIHQELTHVIHLKAIYGQSRQTIEKILESAKCLKTISANDSTYFDGFKATLEQGKVVEEELNAKKQKLEDESVQKIAEYIFNDGNLEELSEVLSIRGSEGHSSLLNNLRAYANSLRTSTEEVNTSLANRLTHISVKD